MNTSRDKIFITIRIRSSVLTYNNLGSFSIWPGYIYRVLKSFFIIPHILISFLIKSLTIPKATALLPIPSNKSCQRCHLTVDHIFVSIW